MPSLSEAKKTNFTELEAEIDVHIKYLDYLISRNALTPTDVLQLIKKIRTVETIRRTEPEEKLSATQK